LPRQVQLKRIRQVIERELTACQRQTLIAYYFRQMTMPEIAQEQGVNKSTVCRTLHRAEEKLRRYLRY
jgi:RNA polymerase sigma factor (sigma-70 family)